MFIYSIYLSYLKTYFYVETFDPQSKEIENYDAKKIEYCFLIYFVKKISNDTFFF